MTTELHELQNPVGPWYGKDLPPGHVYTPDAESHKRVGPKSYTVRFVESQKDVSWAGEKKVVDKKVVFTLELSYVGTALNDPPKDPVMVRRTSPPDNFLDFPQADPYTEEIVLRNEDSRDLNLFLRIENEISPERTDKNGPRADMVVDEKVVLTAGEEVIVEIRHYVFEQFDEGMEYKGQIIGEIDYTE